MGGGGKGGRFPLFRGGTLYEPCRTGLDKLGNKATIRCTKSGPLRCSKNLYVMNKEPVKACVFALNSRNVSPLTQKIFEIQTPNS